MSYRLYLRPVAPFAAPGDASADAADGQLYQWALQDASGEVQARGAGDTRFAIEQTLAQNALDDVRLVGLIPGGDALFCLADIPAKQSRFVAQALPYAVEEQVAQDIDTVHLALGTHTPDGFRVAAIDRTAMARWYDTFSGWSGARLEAIYPDAALLPVTEGGWTLALDGEQALMLSDRGEWLSMVSDNLSLFASTLALPGEDTVAAEVPVTVYGRQPELDQQQTLISDLAGQGRLAVQASALDISVVELLAEAFHHHRCQPVNLCQGAFSPAGTGVSPLRPWRPLVAVLAVWFVIQLGLDIGFGLYDQSRAQQLNAQALSVYRQAFPQDTRTHAGNLRRVVEGQLRLAGSQTQDLGFIPLMKYTGEQYGALPAGSDVTFNSINYSQTRGELVVDLRADSYDRLSKLRNGLSAKGLNAEIGSVVNESNGARGRLTVSGG
ncbi:type II secretion system protein GspL [Marinobacter sp. C2H3]|uniref:type II secretion system protein GspL n=1 Tax=Marinobacter sp. C2H3 TaxID=3119003 RepID=UPI00300F5B05